MFVYVRFDVTTRILAMPQNFRHPEILRLARDQGRVLVHDLAKRFGVTVQTIRRDLTELAGAGRLQRVHGGAVIPSGVRNIEYEERQRLNATAKAAMARAVAGLIPDEACIFLNIGTSTEAVAHELLGHDNLLVVTNNLNVAQIFATGSRNEVILTAGRLRKSDGGLTGPLAVRTVEEFRFDLAVIGCSGVSADGDLLDFDMAEVGVSQAAMARAGRTILLADRSKFSRSAPARITGLDTLDTVVTDAAPPAALATHCRAAGTEIVIAAG